MLNFVEDPVNVNVVFDEPNSIVEPVALMLSLITIGLLIVVSLSITKLPALVVILSPFNSKSLEDISNELGLYLMKLLAGGFPPIIEVVISVGNEICTYSPDSNFSNFICIKEIF